MSTDSSDAILLAHQAAADTFPGLEPAPNCRCVVTPIAEPPDADPELTKQRQRWRSLWLNEIGWSAGEQLDAIGRELQLRRRPEHGDDSDYRRVLAMEAQRRLEATAEVTPEGRHRCDVRMVELAALRVCSDELAALEPRARERVLRYVVDMYGSAEMQEALR